MRKDSAASSLLALVLVLALSLVAGTVALRAGAFLSLRERAKERGDRRAELDEALLAWAALYEKESGGPDSAFDPYAGSSTIAALRLEAVDISSRVNPNWMASELFEKTELAALLMPGFSPKELEAEVLAKGFSCDIADSFALYFQPRAIEELLTVHSYADLDTSAPDSLAALYSLCTGDSGAAEHFRQRLLSFRAAHHRVSIEELSSLLSPYGELLFPSISIAPPLNVNFAPEFVLAALLSYPEFGIRDFSDKARRLVEARAGRELDQEGLYSILGIARENPVFAWLGTRTWFWRLKLESSAGGLEAIAARIPPSPGHELEADKYPVLRIVSRSFSP